MALKDIVIYNPSVQELETPHVGDTVNIPENMVVTKDLTVDGSIFASTLGSILTSTATSVTSLSIIDTNNVWQPGVFAFATRVVYKSSNTNALAVVETNTLNSLILQAGSPAPDVNTSYTIFVIGNTSPSIIASSTFKFNNSAGTKFNVPINPLSFRSSIGTVFTVFTQ